MRSGGFTGDGMTADAWLASLGASYTHHTGSGKGWHGAHGSPSGSNTTGPSIQQLIEALVRLEKTVTAGSVPGWPDSTGVKDAKATVDVLSGMAHGAKMGVYGNTAGAVGAGVGGLLSAFGVKGANKYLDAVSGAGSIYNTGAKQGVNVGNVISGAAQGATLGSAFGPVGTMVGAGVGGLLDIFGGLFGHSKPKIPQDQISNPSQYNSPSDFDYYARLYNATGKMTNVPGQTFGQQASTVQVHFYSDGVAQAVQQTTSAAATRSAMSVASAYYDNTRPQ